MTTPPAQSRSASRYFPTSLDGASRLQAALAAEVREEPLPSRPRLVAGADMAFDRQRDRGFAAVVTVDAASGEVVEVGRYSGPIQVPYVPGFLSFREGPAILEAWSGLRQPPDLLVCDGHGRAHPRRFGVACHLGLALDLPTVGVAKSRLVGEHRDPGRRRGSAVKLLHRSETIGLVLRTREGVRPVFVSVGHRIALEEAKRLVLRLADRFRLPEPQRLADQEVARMRRAAT
jgi:deoxyribonuclease V